MHMESERRGESAPMTAQGAQPAAADARPRYTRPALVVFGTITELTRAVGPVGKNDHSGGGRRTGF